jgi:uncharacterized membrane protein YsdA (DUF1294 family)
MQASRKVSRSPFVYYGLWVLGIAAALTAGAVHWLGIPVWAAYLLAINVTVFGFYGLDKWKARRDSFRIPENVLHAASLIGGSPGAYAAMRTFRHKTVKPGFRFVFWTVAAAQAGLLAFLLLRSFGLV